MVTSQGLSKRKLLSLRFGLESDPEVPSTWRIFATPQTVGQMHLYSRKGNFKNQPHNIFATYTEPGQF